MTPGRREGHTRNVGTTRIGYVNQNDQEVIRSTDLPATDHMQRIYILSAVAPAAVSTARTAVTSGGESALSIRAVGQGSAPRRGERTG